MVETRSTIYWYDNCVTTVQITLLYMLNLKCYPDLGTQNIQTRFS